MLVSSLSSVNYLVVKYKSVTNYPVGGTGIGYPWPDGAPGPPGCFRKRGCKALKTKSGGMQTRKKEAASY